MILTWHQNKLLDCFLNVLYAVKKKTVLMIAKFGVHDCTERTGDGYSVRVSSSACSNSWN